MWVSWVSWRRGRADIRIATAFLIAVLWSVSSPSGICPTSPLARVTPTAANALRARAVRPATLRDLASAPKAFVDALARVQRDALNRPTFNPLCALRALSLHRHAAATPSQTSRQGYRTLAAVPLRCWNTFTA
jgi:hypothetical protein